MKKNVASQVIGAQMVSASDGSAFTGTVSVAVTVDGGTQSAGGGTVTHEGNGFHSYTPTQAETNGDHIAFTFTGTGAVPVTIQVYTGFPQTGDSFARLGAPAGASIAADIATRATQASVDAVDDFVDTEVAAIKAKTDQLTFTTPNKVDSTIQAAGDFAQGAADKVWSTATRTMTSLGASLVQEIWDRATAALTTAGSIGKLLVDNINATIASRSTYDGSDTAGTTTLLSRLTAGRATNLDNLDATVSSRLAAASITLTSGKVTPIDVDGLTHAKAMEVLLALVGGKAVPSGSSVAFKKRDGTTTTITVTYGATDGERTDSVIA